MEFVSVGVTKFTNSSVLFFILSFVYSIPKDINCSNCLILNSTRFIYTIFIIVFVPPDINVNPFKNDVSIIRILFFLFKVKLAKITPN